MIQRDTEAAAAAEKSGKIGNASPLLGGSGFQARCAVCKQVSETAEGWKWKRAEKQWFHLCEECGIDHRTHPRSVVLNKKQMAAVVDAIKAGCDTSGEVVEMTQLSTRRVADLIQQLIKSGFLKRTGHTSSNSRDSDIGDIGATPFRVFEIQHAK